MKIYQAIFNLSVLNIFVSAPDTKIFNTERAITPKAGKAELRFMCSARRLMVFNICVKFHENMSSGFKVMEWTQKLLTDRQRERERERE